MNTFFNIQSKLNRLIGLAALLALAACQTNQQGNNNTYAAASASVNAAPSIAKVSNWTEADFMNAKPMPIPTATVSVNQMKAMGESETPLQLEPVSFEGRAGSGSLDAATNLFTPSAAPIPPLGSAPVAVGSRGAYYSSSRLVPESARLAYPYSTAGKIFFKDQAGTSFVCSGSVIKKRLIATAGHCVHSGTGGSNGYYRDIVFVPAYSSNGTQAPFGTWSATWFKASPTWVNGGGGVPNAADFAVIEVADQEINGSVRSLSHVVGRLGYKTNSLTTNHIKMLGYPVAMDNGLIMHQVDSGDPAAGGSGTVLYGSDLTGGASGGPWVQNFGARAAGQPTAGDDEMNRLVGITSYVFTASEPKVAGSSILNQEFIDLLNEGCARDSGNCD